MFRSVIVCALAICLVTNISSAQDEKKKKGKGKQRGRRNFATQIMGRFKSVDLTEEQQEKMKGIINEFSAKLMDLRKQQFDATHGKIYKARTEAAKKARGPNETSNVRHKKEQRIKDQDGCGTLSEHIALGLVMTPPSAKLSFIDNPHCKA